MSLRPDGHLSPRLINEFHNWFPAFSLIFFNSFSTWQPEKICQHANVVMSLWKLTSLNGSLWPSGLSLYSLSCLSSTLKKNNRSCLFLQPHLLICHTLLKSPTCRLSFACQPLFYSPHPHVLLALPDPFILLSHHRVYLAQCPALQTFQKTCGG